MAEHLKVVLGGPAGAARFDEVLASSLSEGGDLELVVKDGATAGGQPAIVVTFTVEVDGVPQRAQAVTTLKNFLLAAGSIAVRYPPVVQR